MSPEVAVFQRMQAIVPTGRFYQLKAPQQETSLHAVVQLVDDPEVNQHMRGGSIAGVARVQISFYRPEAAGVDPYDTAATLAEQVHGDHAGSGLCGFQGHIGGSPGGMFITGIRHAGRRALYEPNELREVGIQEDYFVHYRHL